MVQANKNEQKKIKKLREKKLKRQIDAVIQIELPSFY